MSIQPTRTPAQQAAQDAAACPTCDANPDAAPGRYCAIPCNCGHVECPAFDAAKVLRRVREVPALQPDSAESGAVCETMGARKTAPGVASTNTEGLVQPSATKPTRSDVST